MESRKMYQKFFIVLFSLFLLVLTTLAQHGDYRVNQDSALPASPPCADHLLPVSTGGSFQALVHESADCKK